MRTALLLISERLSGHTSAKKFPSEKELDFDRDWPSKLSGDRH